MGVHAQPLEGLDEPVTVSIPWLGRPLGEGSVEVCLEHGLPAVVVRTPAVSATVFLHGAHVAEWVPAGESPVIWMGPNSHFANDQPLRGGVPVCLPWFGPGRTGDLTPGHGWARLRTWSLESVAAAEDGGVDVVLVLPASSTHREDLQRDELSARFTAHLGRTLRLSVAVTNVSGHSTSAELALHAYWATEAREATIEGLDDLAFLDRVGGETPRRAQRFPRFDGTTIDRLYPAPERLTLHDHSAMRDVVLESSDAEQIVVWNPGIAGCATADDLGADDWKHMVCLEAARVRDRALDLEPGETQTMTLDVHVESSTDTVELPRLANTIVAPVEHPVRIIQFGEGNFLRAFVAPEVQRLNDMVGYGGGIAIVQPRPGGHVADLEVQDRLFTVHLEGLEGGQPIARSEVMTSVVRTVNPYAEWEAFLALADEPTARVVVSNTTEAGIALDPRDTADSGVPFGFPAKLARLMERRFAAGLPGFVVIPCELINDNGTVLREKVLECARVFGFNADLVEWIATENTFCCSLVDRIVPGFPTDRVQDIWNELGYEDDQLVCAEPFLFWAIQGPAWVQEVLPLHEVDSRVVFTDDITPYRDRKVSLLNGPHTTLGSLARNAGFGTVGEAMDDPTMGAFIRAEMHEEIVPVVALPTDELETFAAQVEDRFRNPFVHHSLDSIALNAIAKFRARLLPLIHANVEVGRPLPRRIVLALAGLLWTYSGQAPAAPVDVEDVIVRFAHVLEPGGVADVLAATDLWGEDLTAIPGLGDLVATDVAALADRGVSAVLAELTTEEN